MKLIHVSRSGKKTDFSEIAKNYSWSGDKSQVARMLRCSVLSSSIDKYFRSISIEIGETILLYSDQGTELFRGYIFRKERSLGGFQVEYTAYDALIYLTRSKISRNFKKTTAEAITRTICAELGVAVGAIASTGYTQTLAALNKTGYKVILEAYTKASKITGKKYIPIMQKNKLDIIEKGKTKSKTRLTADTNIEDATYTESIEDKTVTVVKITDDKGNYVGEVSNADNKKNYGTLQEIYQKEKGVDSRKAAQSMLKGIERTATVQALGNDDFDQVTGNAIYIKEEQTGLTGLFYIDADEHSFSEGQHKISLTVEFQNMMDEV